MVLVLLENCALSICNGYLMNFYIVSNLSALQEAESHMKCEAMHCITYDRLSFSSNEMYLSNQKSNLIWTSIPRPS